MDAFGKRLFVVVTAAALTALTGCSSAPSAESAEGASQPTGSARPTNAGGFCLVDLPESWQEELEEGRLSRDQGERLNVKLVTPDGSLLLQSALDGVRNELRWRPAGDAEEVVVDDFGADNAEWQVVGAASDGRYVAYSVYHSLRVLGGSWSLYLWDSERGGDPREIAESPRDDSGDPVSGPLNYPVVHQGEVAWVAATGGADEETAIYRYDVGDSSREVVRTGHPWFPFRMGELLVWPESPGPGEATRLRGVSLETGDEVSLPGPLADLEGPAFIDANEDTVVWTGRKMRRLWVWHTSWDEPREVLDTADASIEWIHVGTDLVVWNHRELGQHALDLRSGGYAQLTPEWGSSDLGGNHLLVGFPPDADVDKRDAVSEQVVIDAAELPQLPGC